jgi:RHS repeat-associated protein
VVDVDGDGRVDLVSSVRVGGAKRLVDCDGALLPAPEYLEGDTASYVYLNTGSGWVLQPLPSILPDFFALTVVQNEDDITPWGDLGEPSPPAQPETCQANGHFRGTDYQGDAVCLSFIDAQPRFIELNGDGRIDLLVLSPTDPAGYTIADNSGIGSPQNPGASRAWVQTGDGIGWARAQPFDLANGGGFPAHHWRYEYSGFPGGVLTSFDIGVRFVDLNRDGLTDVAFRNDENGPYDPEPGSEVLLNTGSGWCSSASAACEDASRYRLPSELAYGGLTFAELNGDGWIDLARTSGGYGQTAWIHSTPAPGGSVWAYKASFNPPISTDDCGSGGPPCVASGQLVDVDANGRVDILRARQGGDRLARRTVDGLVDLLAQSVNSFGGTVSLAYKTGAQQRDPALESAAELHAQRVGEGDAVVATGITRGSTLPVVTQRTASGYGFVSGAESYRYARPRWSTVDRSRLGFRLVEATRPDGSRVSNYFYQSHGIAGRLSEQIVADAASSPLFLTVESWVAIAGNLPGSIASAAVGRLLGRSTHTIYPGPCQQTVQNPAANPADACPTQSQTRLYDDSYGYNFASQITQTRATGTLVTVRTPAAADTTNWIVGLPQEVVLQEQPGPAGSVLSRSSFSYYASGRIQTVSREVRPRNAATPVDTAVTTWVYDSYGNVVEVREPRATASLENRSVYLCYDGDANLGGVACPSPSGQTSHSALVGIRDPMGGVTAIEPYAASGKAFKVVLYAPNSDELRFVRDGFGRVLETWITPAETGQSNRLESFAYHDATAPPYVERWQYASASDPTGIRTALYLDGFGRVARFVETTPATSSAPAGYRGRVTWRNFATRETRETYPHACGIDPHCSSLTGQEAAATRTTTDAIGRTLQRGTPDGFSVYAHYRVDRSQPVGPGSGHLFDAVLRKGPRGDLVRRVLDGQRIVWVDECQNTLAPAATSVPDLCTTPDQTFYVYEPTGEVSTTYDAVATTGSYNDAAHRLAYEYDTLGQTLRTLDPDGGESATTYDLLGNVSTVTNARGKTTVYGYDALDRLVSVNLPDTSNDVVVTYDPVTREVDRETRDGYYWLDHDYDALGRESRRTQSTANITMRIDFEHDLLGRLTKIVYPSPNTDVSYGYEGAYLKTVCGRPTVAECASSPADYFIEDVEYDSLGRPVAFAEPPGVRGFEYDADTYQLSSLEYSLPDETLLQRVEYLRDEAGNVTSLLDLVDAPQSFDAEYSYDPRNRIRTYRPGTSPTRYFRFDSLGNVVLRDGASDTEPANQLYAPDRPHAITQAYNGLTFAYDADGNATRRGSQHLTYDAQNRLVCAGPSPGSCADAKFAYTLDGARYWETKAGSTPGIVFGDYFQWDTPTQTATARIYAFGRQIAYRVSHNASLRGAESLPGAWLPFGPEPVGWAVAIVLGSGLLVLAVRAGVPAHAAERPAAAATAVVVVLALLPVPARAGGPPIFGDGGNTWVPRWIVHDHLGSGVFVLDATGGLVRQRVFEPFGRVDAQTGPGEPNTHFFTGQRFVAGASLYDFQARWYDPEAARFLSVDPIVGDLRDPQAHNAYSYVGNNPVNFIDPSGLSGEAAPSLPVQWSEQQAVSSASETRADDSEGDVSEEARPDSIDELIQIIQSEFPEAAIRVTGRGRTIRRQAELMADQIRTNRDVFLQTYADRPHIREMDRWVQEHPTATREHTVAEFERIIGDAVATGETVSRHLSDTARDISIPRGGADVQQRVQQRIEGLGGSVIREPTAAGGPHWHLDWRR